MAATTPKIKLYTNHNCPWAYRVHIALAELQVPFEEEIIDLSVPRTPEYLRINPRGLVPTMEYDGEVLTESAVVAGFLADTFPSALLPASSTPGGPLTRAKVAFFVDTYFSKAHGLLMSIMSAKSDGEAKNLADEFVNVLATELDPLLADAKPFFGGSPKLTLAEVLTGSFILRLYAFTNCGFLPSRFQGDLVFKAYHFDKWAKEVIKHPSVTCIWDEEAVVARMRERLASIRSST